MNLILIRENGPAFFQAAYYFFICNEANGFSHAFDDVSCAIVISCFVCDIAHVRVVTERVALFRARFPSVVCDVTRIHAQGTVFVLWISDKNAKKV